MPSNVQAYNEWLASAPDNVAVIEMIDISHPSWGHLRIARWGVEIQVREESGLVETYQPGFFELTRPPVTDTLENNTQVTISAMDGVLYNALNDLTEADRESPITLIQRMVRSDGAVNDVFEELMVDPPPIWNVAQVKVDEETVAAEIRADPMRTRRVGIYYTDLTFPVLTYV